MQNLSDNSFEIKRNLNWSESARKNLPTVKEEWLYNSELPSLKESEMSEFRFFKLFSFVLYHCHFYVIFSSLIQLLPTSHCLQWRNTCFCDMLFAVTLWYCTFSAGTFFIHYSPGIYAEGYIVFVFPFLCSFICAFVIPSCWWNYFKVLH